MTLEEFRASLRDAAPPEALTPALRALWHDGCGNWDAAHQAAQEIEDGTGAWVHAYLHRKEGDQGNAAYWYRRADRPICRDPLEREWEDIVNALLG